MHEWEQFMWGKELHGGCWGLVGYSNKKGYNLAILSGDILLLTAYY